MWLNVSYLIGPCNCPYYPISINLLPNKDGPPDSAILCPALVLQLMAIFWAFVLQLLARLITNGVNQTVEHLLLGSICHELCKPLFFQTITPARCMAPFCSLSCGSPNWTISPGVIFGRRWLSGFSMSIMKMKRGVVAALTSTQRSYICLWN